MRRDYAPTALGRHLGLASRALASFRKHDGTLYAAAVSYYVFLSLFPLLVFVASILGLLARDPGVRERVTATIIDQIPKAITLRGQISDFLADLSMPGGGLLGLAGLLVSVWSASGMFGALRAALNRIFDVPSARPYMRGKLTDMLGVLGAILLAASSAAASAGLALLLSAARGSRVAPFLPAVLELTGWLPPLGLSFFAFLTLYRMLPDKRLDFGHLWPGALLAGVGVETCKYLFNLYLLSFTRYERIYGALAGPAAFLLFVFLAASVVLLGAEFSSAVASDRREVQAAPPRLARS